MAPGPPEAEGGAARLRLGVLALQGAFREHAAALKRVAPDADVVTIRNAVRDWQTREWWRVCTLGSARGR